MRGRFLGDDDPTVVNAYRALYGGRAAEAYALVRRHCGPAAENVAVAALILLGRLRRAERRLRRMYDEDVDYPLVPALLFLKGRDVEADAALAGVRPEFAVTPGGHALAVALHRSGYDVVEVLPYDPDGMAFDRAGGALFYEGAYAETVAWYSRGTRAHHAYNAACACARMGDGDAGLRWLGTAIDRGWDDAAMLDTDDDLASLRTLPGWAALRARLGDPEPPH